LVKFNLLLYQFLAIVYQGVMIKIRVTDMEGIEHVFEITEDTPESILDIAERNGVYLPFSCRSGACYSCCAEVSQ
jgi:ferredoxin